MPCANSEFLQTSADRGGTANFRQAKLVGSKRLSPPPRNSWLAQRERWLSGLTLMRQERPPFPGTLVVSSRGPSSSYGYVTVNPAGSQAKLLLRAIFQPIF